MVEGVVRKNRPDTKGLLSRIRCSSLILCVSGFHNLLKATSNGVQSFPFWGLSCSCLFLDSLFGIGVVVSFIRPSIHSFLPNILVM